ncbi:hypothetical protein [Pelobium manganitolerans]|uniref:hypothetical protein n=1 Tax=Pelobium manganitolerans TaxID=1842495 RepID=UPI003FA35EF0
MREKIVHLTDKQCLKEGLRPSKLFFMHNLSTNFRLFLDITKSAFKDKGSYGLSKRGELLKGYSRFAGDWVEDASHILFSSQSGSFRFVSMYDKKAGAVLWSAKKLYENQKYNLVLPALTAVGDGYFIGVINSLYLKHYLTGASVLSKYANLDYNSFLVVKVKFKEAL